jgi:hypothetical protein
VLQALAARQLSSEGLKLEAGETVSYIMTNDRFRKSRVTAASLVDSETEYNIHEYIRLLWDAASMMLVPFDWIQ